VLLLTFTLAQGDASTSATVRRTNRVDLIVHTTTLGAGGNVEERTWSDPVSGRSRALTYDSRGKLFIARGVLRVGEQEHSVTVNYELREWTSGTRIERLPSDHIWIIDAHSLPGHIRKLVAEKLLVSLGRKELAGKETLHLRGKVGFVTGDLWVSGLYGDLWVDASSFLPLSRRRQGARHGQIVTQDAVYLA
jgi:hypothetical protein